MTLLAPLHQHLHQHGVDYLQFSFRWMNNLLTREIPLHCTIRLWDTYLAESDKFASFQLYVCAAFLLRWRRHLLLQPDFQVIHPLALCYNLVDKDRSVVILQSSSMISGADVNATKPAHAKLDGLGDRRAGGRGVQIKVHVRRRAESPAGPRHDDQVTTFRRIELTLLRIVAKP